MNKKEWALCLRLTAFSFVLLLCAACGKTPAAPALQNDQPTEIQTEEATTRTPADRTAEEVYEAHPELTPVNYESPALLPKTEDMGQEYIDNVTFLCDSPTYWLKPFALLNGGADTTQIWTGPEGTMTLAYLRDYEILDPFDNEERTIAAAMELHQPPFVIIALGVNGISFMDEAYFKEEYTALVESIRAADPDVTLVFQSIYPISPAYRYWGDITNETVTAANAWILELAETLDAKYLDTFSCLVGEDGNIQADLVMDDGLHPNKAGLTKVLEYIRTHGVR